MTKRIIYFVDGITPDVGEIADIGKLEAASEAPYEVIVVNGDSNNIYGEVNRTIPTDYVAGSVPVNYNAPGAKATATVKVEVNPEAGKTITVDGAEYEFAVEAGTGKIEIGVDADATATAIAAAVNGGSFDFSATADDNTVALIADDIGVAGNEFTLATDSEGIVLSGATFEGGRDDDFNFPVIDPDDIPVELPPTKAIVTDGETIELDEGDVEVAVADNIASYNLVLVADTALIKDGDEFSLTGGTLSVAVANNVPTFTYTPD